MHISSFSAPAAGAALFLAASRAGLRASCNRGAVMRAVARYRCRHASTGLGQSGKKPGGERTVRLLLSRSNLRVAQRARLGHRINFLDSHTARYINLTDPSWVRELHSPFGKPAGTNEKLNNFFRKAFTGQPAEAPLRFPAEGNWYKVSR